MLCLSKISTVAAGVLVTYTRFPWITTGRECGLIKAICPVVDVDGIFIPSFSIVSPATAVELSILDVVNKNVAKARMNTSKHGAINLIAPGGSDMF
jgi:hypothetical protein